MLPWFPIALVGCVGIIALVTGLLSYSDDPMPKDDGGRENTIIGGLVLIALAMLAVLWNTVYMLGAIKGFWS